MKRRDFEPGSKPGLIRFFAFCFGFGKGEGGIKGSLKYVIEFDGSRRGNFN